MAGNDPERQLLTLIRDLTSEKSQGERRVVGLKKRIEELRSDLDTANADLEERKRLRETTEQEVKGYEVELGLNDSSLQALEARIALFQDEISSVGSEVEALKNEENSERDDFISRMLELNSRIRKFHEMIATVQTEKRNITGTAAVMENVATDSDLRSLEEMLSDLVAQRTKEEQECQAEENTQKQVQRDFADIQRKISLIEAIVKETKALQDLTRQTSELEQACSTLGEELQKRCLCPSCHADNVEILLGVLHPNAEAN